MLDLNSVEDIKPIAKIILIKKATSLAFNEIMREDGNISMLCVLVADKAGMVYKFELPEGKDFRCINNSQISPGQNINGDIKFEDSNKVNKPILGHVSMLLDMVFSSDRKYVITCDRDEKIRVSLFPNSYIIQSFCLAHTKFVSSIITCESLPDILFSSSGDGTIKIWQFMSGTLLYSRSLNSDLEKERFLNANETNSCIVLKLDIKVVHHAKESIIKNSTILLAALVHISNTGEKIIIYTVEISSDDYDLKPLQIIQPPFEINNCKHNHIVDFRFGLDISPSDNNIKLYTLCSNENMFEEVLDDVNHDPLDKDSGDILSKSLFTFSHNPIDDNFTLDNPLNQENVSRKNLEYRLMEKLLFSRGKDFYEDLCKEDKYGNPTDEYSHRKKIRKNILKSVG
ncbi:unnamed protein product [Gordionus sp. m RMFG-2023]